MSYTLTAQDIAALATASPGRVIVRDPAARALAQQTKEAHKRQALADAERAAERFTDYTDSQHARIVALRDVHWPRARAIRAEMSACRERIRRHNDVHDDYRLSVSAYHDVIIRECRLSALLARAYAASAEIGRFPISRADMRTDKPTRFIGSAAARHFTFAGGRDWASLELDAADIVQGAFVRAIDAGDTVHGVPTFGSMFRHVQSERAHQTRIRNAEYAARKRAALGDVTGATEEWPEPGDKHAMRLLASASAPNGKRYATLTEHRESLADIHRDAERATMDDYVTRGAREDALASATGRAFHEIVADLLMRGATVDALAESQGIKPETLAMRVRESASASLMPMATGIDHAMRSADMLRAAEREHAVDVAQAAHAERMRIMYVNAQADAYANRML